MKKWLAILMAATLLVSLAGCGRRVEQEATSTVQGPFSPTPDARQKSSASKKPALTPEPEQSQVPVETQAPEEAETPADTAAATQAPAQSQAPQDLIDGMSPAFKEAMDSYEEFMDGYVAFMKKYSENPNDLDLLSDYATYMSQYADFVDAFETWEDEEMNAAETVYYIEVQARVSKKLLEVAQ